MALRDWIDEALRREFSTETVSVLDESHLHAGHAGWREGGETHFRVDVVSPAFAGKSRVERHRLVNQALAPAFARGLHALAIKARAPGE
ncbi:BolA family protein [Enterovirga rhinocerotis]|uniref:BolA protein n=1 Tax=Enterovirga rhinocerotis TaxID=1339210 RepID=A0A4R7BVT9_9HYPH|nr:BolA protein [Enterovirga rhinocerotis]